MVGVEWNILAGIIGAITGAATTGVVVGRFQGRIVERVDNIEKFVEKYPRDDEVKCARCHGELIDEIRENRREQQEEFSHLNERLDKVISFRRRNGEMDGG